VCVCVCVCACRFVSMCVCVCMLRSAKLVPGLSRTSSGELSLTGHLSLTEYTYTGWRRLIGSPKLQIIFHKRATKYRSLLRKMTYKDKGSYESSPPCTQGACRLQCISLFWCMPKEPYIPGATHFQKSPSKGQLVCKGQLTSSCKGQLTSSCKGQLNCKGQFT